MFWEDESLALTINTCHMRFFDWVKWQITTFKRYTSNDLSYCHRRDKAKIYLKVNKNLSPTTFTCLRIRLISKALYIAFFSPVNFRFFFPSCYCLVFFYFYYSFSTKLYTANFIQQLTIAIKFPCKICNKAVANNQCDKYHIWVHIKCIKINLQTYKCLQKKPFGFVLRKVLWRHCSFWDYLQWGTL